MIQTVSLKNSDSPNKDSTSLHDDPIGLLRTIVLGLVVLQDNKEQEFPPGQLDLPPSR